MSDSESKPKRGKKIFIGLGLLGVAIFGIWFLNFSPNALFAKSECSIAINELIDDVFETMDEYNPEMPVPQWEKTLFENRAINILKQFDTDDNCKFIRITWTSPDKVTQTRQCTADGCIDWKKSLEIEVGK